MLPPRQMAIAVLTKPRAAGGYDFLADPSQRADQATVFWHPDEAATVVLLTTAPNGANELRFAPDRWAGDAFRRDAADGIHMIIRCHGARHQLWLDRRVSDGAVLTANIPLDFLAPHRAEATIRFWKHATYGRRRGQPDRSRRPHHLTPALRALDGHLDGASYRVIADGLFGTSRVAADPWKTSPMRDRVIRLVRQGLSLMRGRYRSLLRPIRRD